MTFGYPTSHSFQSIGFFSWLCSIHQLPTAVVIAVKGKNIFHSEAGLEGGAVSDWYIQWGFLSCGKGESESWLPLWSCISSLVCKTGLSLLHIGEFSFTSIFNYLQQPWCMRSHNKSSKNKLCSENFLIAGTQLRLQKESNDVPNTVCAIFQNKYFPLVFLLCQPIQISKWHLTSAMLYILNNTVVLQQSNLFRGLK